MRFGRVERAGVGRWVGFSRVFSSSRTLSEFFEEDSCLFLVFF